MIDQNQIEQNKLETKILASVSAEIATLRRLLGGCEAKNDVASAIQLAAAIARIYRDAHAAQYQLDQMASAMVSKGAGMVMDAMAEQRARQNANDQKNGPVENAQNGEADLTALGPAAMQALSAIAEISKKLGGGKPHVTPAPDLSGEPSK